MLLGCERMDRLLARLERRLGRFAIPNLIWYVVGGMAVVWLLAFARSPAVERLPLIWPAVLQGEVWRLVTFVFMPLPWEPYWVLIGMYFLWWVGSSLEQHWGAFRFNVYFLTGMLGAIGCAAWLGMGTNIFVDESMFLAFATLFPDAVVMLMFILPVRVKWLGIAMALYMAYQCVQGGTVTRIMIGASMINYFLFFGGHWLDRLRSRNVQIRQQARREAFKESASVFGQRQCAICGAREAEGADIRVCSCERCGGQPRTLCLQHARNH
jgi:hypothetical protein